eukprot:10325345-Prorocentrum_lima.AAC.1
MDESNFSDRPADWKRLSCTPIRDVPADLGRIFSLLSPIGRESAHLHAIRRCKYFSLALSPHPMASYLPPLNLRKLNGTVKRIAKPLCGSVDK